MRRLASAVIAVLTLGAQAYAEGAPDIAGTWLTEDGRAKIRTEHCGEGSQKLCGFVVWMKNPLDDNGQPRTDFKNPDPAKRSRPSLGLELMTNLKPEDPTHFSGEIYNAEDGKMYSVTVSAEKAQELQVHGCLLRFLCGSQTWTRVADLPIPSNSAKVVSNSGTAKAAPKPATAPAKHDTAPAIAK